jgi:predicted transcriptional regulator
LAFNLDFLGSIFFKTISILQIQVGVSLWIILLIFILLVLWLVKLLFFVTKKRKNRDLSNDEVNLLNLIVNKDGQAVTYNYITSNLQIKKLKAEQIVEALSELELIESYENNFEGTQTYLTEKGRDFILGNDFKRT